MGKQRTTVSLDDDVYEELQDADVNYSALVNKWTRDYLIEGRRPAVDRDRIQTLDDQLSEERAEFETVVEDARQVFDQLRASLDAAAGGTPDLDDLADAIDDYHAETTIWTTNALGNGNASVRRTGGPERTPSNPAVRQEAERLGITPARLVEELEERDRERREELLAEEGSAGRVEE